MGVVMCSVKEAVKLMEHMSDDDIVILTVFDNKTYIHDIPQRIKKVKGEELVRKADNIRYQDNDFFGTLSLYGVVKENDSSIHNILFPQLE